MPVYKAQLLIATSNSGKLAELREQLEGSGFGLLCNDDMPPSPDVEETGTTFTENACLKAIAYSQRSGVLALADDSGLEVDALNGGPGITSARYGGADLTYAEKINKLLSEMAVTGSSEMSARFVCAMAVAAPNGNVLARSLGVCEGRIVNEPRGENGFGYDPIFVPDGYDLTFGELSNHVKGQISHRARAIKEIIPFLQHFNID